MKRFTCSLVAHARAFMSPVAGGWCLTTRSASWAGRRADLTRPLSLGITFLLNLAGLRLAWRFHARFGASEGIRS